MAASRRPPRPLKVFRTPIGFHDAYVAAPSRAAALRAWGSARDLFARGAAEEVTDPALTAEPLARPGEVVKRSRGTAAEQIAALPERPAARPVPAATPAPAAPPEPRPDRAAVVEAEQALANAERRAADILRDLDERAAALDRERRTAERTAKEDRRRCERTRDRAVAAYDAAMARWQTPSADAANLPDR